MTTSSSSRSESDRLYSMLTLMVPSEFSEGQQVTAKWLKGSQCAFLNSTELGPRTIEWLEVLILGGKLPSQNP